MAKSVSLKCVAFFAAQTIAIRIRPPEKATIPTFRDDHDSRVDAQDFLEDTCSESDRRALFEMRIREAWPVRNQTSHSRSKANGRTFVYKDFGDETYNCVVPPAGHKYDFCQLEVCTQGKPQSPRVFVEMYVDGEGHRLQNILKGMLVAKRYGLQFGGLVVRKSFCGAGGMVTDHNHDFSALLDSFFGTADHKLFWYGTPPCFDTILGVKDAPPKHNYTSFNWTSLFFEGFEMDTGNIFIPNTNFLPEESADLDLAAELRKPLAPKVSFFGGGRLSVAIHVRRDDLSVDKAPTPDEYFVRLIDAALELYPDAEIHLWSSIGKKSINYNEGDFVEFVQHGARLHLDTDIVEAWAHMSHADVFIADSSRFSDIPRLINSNCVVWHPWQHGIMRRTDINFTNQALGTLEQGILELGKPVESSLKDMLRRCTSGKK